MEIKAVEKTYDSNQKDLLALLLFVTTAVGYVAGVYWFTRIAPRLLLHHELLLERCVSEAENLFNKSPSETEVELSKEPSEGSRSSSHNNKSQLVDLIKKKRQLTQMKKMLSSCRKERGRYEVDMIEIFSPTHSGATDSHFFEAVLAATGPPLGSPPLSPTPVLSSDDSSSWVTSSGMASKEVSHQADGGEAEHSSSDEKDQTISSGSFSMHLPAGLRTLYWLPKWLHYYYLFLYFNVNNAVMLLLQFGPTLFVVFYFKSDDVWHNLIEIPDETTLVCIHALFRYAMSIMSYVFSFFFATALLIDPLYPSLSTRVQDDTRSFRTEPCGVWWWCAVSYLIVRFAHRVFF